MSSHVGSRWFRPPEIILVQKQYGEGIDMWAIGCVLYELMAFAMQQETGA
jgi:serine/threonine protein kinase